MWGLLNWKLFAPLASLYPSGQKVSSGFKEYVKEKNISKWTVLDLKAKRQVEFPGNVSSHVSIQKTKISLD